MIAWLVAMVPLVTAIAAQVPAQDKAVQPERLFRSREPVEMTLRAPLGQVFKDRDTMSTKSWPGTIEVMDEKRGLVVIPVVLETRGHFRLQRAGCSFAPLKVRFAKDATKGTIFNDQKTLKLVTHCQAGARYEQNLLVEEATYRMYNALTPLSHRTRLARVRYVPEDSSKALTRFGFFIEDDDDMAKRNNGKLLMQTGGSFSDMEPSQMDLVSLFQYMIGNTDWSVFAIHNIRVVDRVASANGFYFPVAYDFDFSGLVGASYAEPDERLPIKSVKTRLYRGPCRTISDLMPILELFNARRDSIYVVLQQSSGLTPGRGKEAREYLEGFFDEIKEPKYFDRALGYACRGR